ncbi:helix-turn-helix domain-containing protein [Sphingobacterium sp. Lzh-3]|uniref:helix-turn-helix domain-containing protein n=1 Tax=Sphingobacterium sp. Lzh-3 TaxID=3382150 RepID=UPI00398D4144
MRKSPFHIAPFLAIRGIQPISTRSKPDFVRYPLQAVPWELIHLPDCRIALQSRPCLGVHIQLVEISSTVAMQIPYSVAVPCCSLMALFEGELAMYGQAQQHLFGIPSNSICLGYHPAGEYLLHFPAGEHRFMLISIDQEWPCDLKMHFPAFAELLSVWLSASPAAVFLPYIPLSKAMCALLDRIRFSPIRKFKDSLAVLCAFEQCIARYHKQLSRQQQATNSRLAAAGQSLQDYLLRNYNDDLALRICVICRQLGWTKSQLSRIAAVQLKKSIRQYIGDSRLDRACLLLRKSTLSIVAISLETGYTDPDYFSKLFKRKMGLSPTDYRNKEV